MPAALQIRRESTSFGAAERRQSENGFVWRCTGNTKGFRAAEHKIPVGKTLGGGGVKTCGIYAAALSDAYTDKSLEICQITHSFLLKGRELFLSRFGAKLCWPRGFLWLFVQTMLLLYVLYNCQITKPIRKYTLDGFFGRSHRTLCRSCLF